MTKTCTPLLRQMHKWQRDPEEDGHATAPLGAWP